MFLDSESLFEFENITKPYISELNIEFQFYWEDKNEDVNIVSKMAGWESEMSFDVLIKGDYLTIALSKTGDESENIYIDKNVLLEQKWNTCKIKYENGELYVCINDENFYEEYDLVEKIYGSTQLISVGTGKAYIRNLCIDCK